jgi:hypothetical protein
MQSTLEHTILQLLDERPIPAEKIIAEIGEAARVGNEADLSIVVKIAHLNDLMDEMLAYPAMALLPGWGTSGIDVLSRMAMEGPHYATAFSVLAVIALARVPTNGDVHFLPESWDGVCRYTISQELTQSALRSLRKVVLEHARSERVGGTYFARRERGKPHPSRRLRSARQCVSMSCHRRIPSPESRSHHSCRNRVPSRRWDVSASRA